MMMVDGQRTVAGCRAFAVTDRRLSWSAYAGAAFVAVYALGTASGVPHALLSQIFNVPMVVVLAVAWATFLAAPREIRPIWLLLAAAATCWGVGSVGWIIEFEQNGERTPTPPTVWDIPFALGLAATATAVILAIRRSIAVRHVALDALVVSCAAITVGTALVARSFERPMSLRTLAALDRPVFGLLTLVLVVSAALGSSDGVRRSTALLGLGQVFLVAGHLIYSFQSLAGHQIDDRWCDLAWATGAVISTLAGLCVIFDDDPLIRFGPAILDSPHPRGSRAALGAGCLAVMASLLVALYGTLDHPNATTVVGILGGLVGVIGVTARGRGAGRAADSAYGSLDRALAANERQNDAVAQVNADLAETNMQLRLYQMAVRSLLSLVNERSDGALKDLVMDTTGADLAEMEDGTS